MTMLVDFIDHFARQFQGRNLMHENSKKAVRLFGCIPVWVLVFVCRSHFQQGHVIYLGVDRAELATQRASVEVEQVLAKGFLHNCALLFIFHFAEFKPVLLAYRVKNYLKTLVSFVFSHVAFLLWVGSVATVTIAGFGVAFYFGGTV